MKQLSYIVIALGFVVVLLVLMGQQRFNERKMISTMANGINIYKSICLNESIDNRTFQLPKSTGDESFKTSTDFLRCFVTSGYMNVTFEFFSAAGSKRPPNNAPENFTSEYNAWCIVADITSDTSDNAPVLFTKNLMLNSLDEQPVLTDSPPFGKQGVIIIQKNAKARILKGADIESYFTGLVMTNKVLRP